MKKIDFINELNQRILPFWLKLMDKENGGYYGVVDYQLTPHPESPKGGVIGARHLWSYSAAYLSEKKASYLEAATHAYHFLKTSLWDPQNGGIYWLVDYKGEPINATKHIYAQSFALYGLSEYVKAANDSEALALAISTFHMIEEKCYSPLHQGYFEEFTIDWDRKTNELLNEGEGTIFTTNSHLHLLEAYTNLYTVWPNKDLLKKINHLLNIFYSKIYNHEAHYCYVAFDEEWNRVTNTFSYGHDIETSWLLTETLRVTQLNRPDITEMNKQIANKVATEGVAEDFSLLAARVNGKLDKTRIWWAQAEAVIGFFNAFELTQDEKYLTLSISVWDYIQRHIHDPRLGGEWYARINEEGEPISSLRSDKDNTSGNIADAWKGFYHNSRMCYEMIRRLPN